MSLSHWNYLYCILCYQICHETDYWFATAVEQNQQPLKSVLLCTNLVFSFVWRLPLVCFTHIFICTFSQFFISLLKESLCLPEACRLICLILLPRSLLANKSRNETDNQIAWLTYQVCCFDILQQICSLNRTESTHRENHSIKGAQSSKYIIAIYSKKILRIIFCTQFWKSSKPHNDRQGAAFSQNTVHKYLILQCKEMDLLDLRAFSSIHIWELDRC